MRCNFASNLYSNLMKNSYTLKIEGVKPGTKRLKGMAMALLLGMGIPLKAQTFLDDYLQKFKKVQPSQGYLLESLAPRFEADGYASDPQSKEADYLVGSEAVRMALIQKYGLAEYDYRDSLRRVLEAKYLSEDVVPITIVDMMFQKINPILSNAGRLEYDDDSNYVFNLTGFTGNKYVEQYMLVGHIPVEQLRWDQTKFVLDSNLILSNFSGQPSKLGWTMVVNGKEFPIQLNVPMEFPKDLTGYKFEIKAEVDSGNARLKGIGIPLWKSPMVVKLWAKMTRKLNPYHSDLPKVDDQNISIHFFELDGVKAPWRKAMYTIHKGLDEYGKPRICMAKPLILVEGIDYGYKDYPKGLRDNKYGENGYVDLLKGKTWNVPAQLWEDWESIKDAPQVIDRLRKEGFDVVYVDFYDGAEDMNYNAEVLIGVMQELQRLSCGNEMHVVGVSMGGTVAKRALRLMELRNIPSCVTSFTSFDAPYQGANLPLGLQHGVRYLRNSVGECNDLFHRVLRRPATLQLLANHESSNYRGAEYRKLWVREDSLYGGYPKKPWLFAITNGGSGGKESRQKYDNTTFLEPGMTMSRLSFNFMVALGMVNNYIYDIYAENFYDRNKKEYYSGRIHFLSTFKSHKDNYLYDHVQGSYVKKLGFMKSLTKIPFFKVPFLTEQMCFVPTVSALDITKGNADVSELSFGLKDSVFGQILTQDLKTPFHQVYIPNSNQPHVKLDNSKGGNIEWLIGKLKSISPSEMPVVLKYDYNVRKTHERAFANVTVRGEASFEINGVGNNPKISTSEEKQNRTFEVRDFYVGQCGGSWWQAFDSSTLGLGQHIQATVLRVGSGSRVDLNDQSKFLVSAGNNKLILEKGSHLQIDENASLVIENGSQVIVEEGAELIFKKKGQLILDGPNAMLHIKGDLILDSGVVFEPKKRWKQEVGLVKFSAHGYGYGNAQILSRDEKVELIFNGNGKKGSKNLQIEGTVDFSGKAGGKEVRSLTIDRSQVCFAPSSKLFTTSSLILMESKFDKVEWASKTAGIIQHNGSYFYAKNVEFMHMDTALIYESKSNLDVANCEFEENWVGLYLNYYNPNVRNCKFEKNHNALIVNMIIKDFSVQECEFKKNQTGLKMMNDRVWMGRGYIESSLFQENWIGVDALKVDLTLKCNRFDSDAYSIVHSGGYLRMDHDSKWQNDGLLKSVIGGYNVFVNPKYTGIKLDNSELFADGMNYFFYNKKKYTGTAFIEGRAYVDENADYYNNQNGEVSLGRNIWKPISDEFVADSLNLQFVRLHRNADGSGVVKVTGKLEKTYPSEACYSAKKPEELDGMKSTSPNGGSFVGDEIEAPKWKVVNGLVVLEVEEEMLVEVYNSNGVRVYRGRITPDTSEIPLSTGIYFLSTQVGGVISTQKIAVLGE